MTFTTNLTLQVTERFTSIDLSAAFSGVVAVVSGFAEVDDESFLWEDLHLVTPYSL